MFIYGKRKKKNNSSKILLTLFSPYPHYGVELTRVSADLHPHGSTRTRSLQRLLDATSLK